MATKKIKILVNIGSNDAERLKLGHEKLYMEGDVVSLEDTIADKLIRERMAREYDAATQKEEAEAAEKSREAAIQAALPAAERQLVEEEAKQEAAKRIKARPASAQPATPGTIAHNPHDTVKKVS